MKKDNARMWVGGGVVVLVVLGILLYLPRLNQQEVIASVPCLVPNVPLSKHIHPMVKITIDGRAISLPPDVGITPACHYVTHTHEDAARGVVHVEQQDTRDYTLGDFFRVWGEPLVKEGYLLEVTVGGKKVSDPEKVVFQDGQRIDILYITQSL